MSVVQQTTVPSSTSNFISVFETSVDEYKRKTNKDLGIHPFTEILVSCTSSDAVLALFRMQAQVIDEIREGDDRLVERLGPIVNILFSFSSMLVEGLKLPFSPANIIFAGISMLFVGNDFAVSYNALVDLFERLGNSLRPLEIYIGIPPTAEVTGPLGGIMGQVLSILALWTRIRMSSGKDPLEHAFQKLDRLIREDMNKAVARDWKSLEKSMQRQVDRR